MKLLSARAIWKGPRLLIILALALSAAAPGGWQMARAQGEPTLRVDSYNYSAEGYGWPLGAQVTLGVDDPETPEYPDYSATATAGEDSGDPNQTYVRFTLNSVNLHPGVTIALSDGSVTKEVLLGNLDVVLPDPGQSLVNGVADPNSSIAVEYWGENYAYRHLQAGGDGGWQADFSVLSDPDDQGIVSQLQPGVGCRACQVDAEGDSHCYFFNIPNRYIFARPWNNTVIAREWPVGATLTLSVNDPQTPETPDYTAVQIARPYKWNTLSTRIDFYLAQVLNLRAGIEITLSDGVITKTHTISDISITDMNIDADTVSGLAPPGSVLWVNASDAVREVTAGDDGTWLANFAQAAPGEDLADLKPDTVIQVMHEDSDGDKTEVDLPSNVGMYAPRRIRASIGRGNSIIGNDWPPGTSVTLTVDDPDTPDFPDYEAVQVSQDNPAYPGNPSVQFNLSSITLRPGMLVTLTDETDTRSLIIHNLGIHQVNTFTDIVSGFAAPYSGVWVVVYLADEERTRYVYADKNGNWTADFSQPGLYPDMQQALDLTGEMNIRAHQYDSDGDITHVRWQPTLNVYPSDELISGNYWPNGATVTLTVNDLNTPQSPDLQIPQIVHALWPQRVSFNLSGLFDLQPGQVVTLSDGTFTLSMTIDSLFVTQVDAVADRITGAAPPGADVCISRLGDDSDEYCVPTDVDGEWTADLGYDVQPGAVGYATIYNNSSGGIWATWYAGWNAPDPQTLVFASSNLFDLDVTGNELGQNYFIRLQLFEPLLRPGLEGGLEPAAASAYSLSPDGRVYTFTLRSDAYWSDGAPLTAQHFVDGILRQLDPGLGTGYAPLLFPIQGAQDYYEGVTSDPGLVGVQALDADTLQITLSQPAAHLIEIMATPIVLPVRQELIDLYGEAWQRAGNFQGNGPYQLAERDGAHLLLGPNPYYHSPQQVTFDSVAFSYIPVVKDQLDAYRNGAVDIVFNAAAQYPLIQADPALLADLYIQDSSTIAYLGLNVQHAPLDNLLVRQALAHATDRQALLGLLRPADQIALGIIPPIIEGYQGNAVGLPYNPALAQQLLAEAGYPNGTGFPEIELVVSTQMFPLIEQIAAGWRAVLNIPVRVTTYRNRNQYLNACRANPASCAYHAYQLGWTADYPDGYNYLNDQFQSDSYWNWTGWDNPRYRELMELIAGENDPVQRFAYISEAERILVEDDAAVIPLYFQDQAVLARPGIYPYLEWEVYPSYLTRWGNPGLAPVIEAIHTPLQPLRVGTTVQVSAEVRNLGSNATLIWEWGDGANTTTTGLSATHIYSQAGIYTLRLTVNKPGFGPVSAIYEYIVIYNPAGGFVIGGGWLRTPTSRAIFTLSALYPKKTATKPEGLTEFLNVRAGISFCSTAYDWLVIPSSGGWAVYRGTGRVNHRFAPNGASYQFMVWANDGKPDALRIKIWWLDDDSVEHVVFDNGSQQPIGGGSIVITRK